MKLRPKDFEMICKNANFHVPIQYKSQKTPAYRIACAAIEFWIAAQKESAKGGESA